MGRSYFFFLQKLASIVFTVLRIFDFEEVTTLITELWGADFGLGSNKFKGDQWPSCTILELREKGAGE